MSRRPRRRRVISEEKWGEVRVRVRRGDEGSEKADQDDSFSPTPLLWLATYLPEAEGYNTNTKWISSISSSDLQKWNLFDNIYNVKYCIWARLQGLSIFTLYPEYPYSFTPDDMWTCKPIKTGRWYHGRTFVKQKSSFYKPPNVKFHSGPPPPQLTINTSSSWLVTHSFLASLLALHSTPMTGLVSQSFALVWLGGLFQILARFH